MFCLSEDPLEMSRSSTRRSRRRSSFVVRVRLWARHLSPKIPSYLFQSGLATVSLVVILLVEDAVFRAAIVVAVASSAFTVFIVPNSIAAMPRRVIGGHVVAVIGGGIFSAILLIPVIASAAETSRLPIDMMAALSVGTGMFAMAITNTEHPPAAGTALGLVIHGWSWSAVVFILSSALVLSIIRLALKPRLVNLL